MPGAAGQAACRPSGEEMHMHITNKGEKALRTLTEGQPGRARSFLSRESGKALWNRWLLSWASEKWIGFQQVEVGPGHTAI